MKAYTGEYVLTNTRPVFETDDSEPAPGKICPVMTKDLGYPIYCQLEGCALWVGLGHLATGHCGLRRL